MRTLLGHYFIAICLFSIPFLGFGQFITNYHKTGDSDINMPFFYDTIEDYSLLAISNSSFEIATTVILHFGLNKYTITPEMKKTLDSLTLVLNTNPESKLEISAHSDSRGSADYNLALTQRRSKSISNYLGLMGISQERFLLKNFGETALLNKCDDKIVCTEAMQKENRRVEFKIFNTLNSLTDFLINK